MISLAITTYERVELTMKSFEKALDDDRIGEIVIVDDCSRESVFKELDDRVNALNNRKIKLIGNTENLGMSRNKARAISLCSNDWVIILDSDNVIDSTYLDSIDKIELRKNVIYCPEFARPNFDYREYSGEIFDAHDASIHVWERTFDLILNTCNYLVHRESYGKVYQYNDKVKQSDTIWFNYLWLRSGGSLYITPGMQYDHLVHSGSGWLSNQVYNTKMANQTKDLIKAL